jgi:ATP-dependent RNA helicase HelY
MSEGPLRPFRLDRFQVEAIAALDRGESVLVSAPTGSGKTVVAEHAIDAALTAGRRAFYTTPIKALSNQKFRDLAARLGAARVGLLTGDNAVNGEAPVVVMTTEVLRNMIYADSPALDGLDVVVLDEVHYLQDSYRGPVWEEVIVQTPPDCRLVCLSATISNASEVAGWLRTVRGPTATVVETERPVELIDQYLVADRLSPDLHVLPPLVDGRPNPDGERYDLDRAQVVRGRGQRGRGRRRYRTPRRLEVLEHLAAASLLPAIVFVFSRAGCEEAAEATAAAAPRLTTAPERRRILELVERHTAALRPADLDLLDHDRWLSRLLHGIAAHHAGMVPAFKEAVEACFAEGLVKVVYATETLALGINMPARSVVIESLTKFTGDDHRFLTAAEYTQLTGRAGRRGIDPVGYAATLWSPFVPFGEVAALVANRDFTLVSAFRPTYNMVANLVRRTDLDGAHRLLERSFAQYQADHVAVALRARRDDVEARLEAAAAEASCELGDIDEYRLHLAQDEEARRHERASVRAAATGALTGLRPGTVLEHDAPGDRIVVLGVAERRGSSPRVRALTTAGHVLTLRAADFVAPPDPVGHLELPTPFLPDDRAYRRRLGRQLAGMRLRKNRRRRGTAPGGNARAPSSGGLAQGHPVARCPDRTRHLRAAGRADSLRRQLADFDQRIATRAESLGRRFDVVLGLLEAWGYVEAWTLTQKGAVLAAIFHEADLLVAEAVHDGLFDHLSPPDLAAVASCFVYEHRGRWEPAPSQDPTPELAARAARAFSLAERLRAEERRRKLPETREPDDGCLMLTRRWAGAGDLNVALADEELAAGDFVRVMRQLIDLLRQIGDVAPDPATRSAAQRAARLVDRGVVAAGSMGAGGAEGGP